ncbi:Rieske (2Fe-2S) protein [Marixanthomonas spongiae]|uniref:Rieske domain-containing protein n=1 Tax=Marixanthomonas spongiae TaxID=2174845 RepID=A0A2U0I2M1_9FLAO|nr:hypothetical protein [Marixanthomonas spongiae]PVW15362.1 hypothetical protein DDV96_08160 [Marixanthomonas spongiae]
MKRIVFVLSLFILFACKSDDEKLDDNPYLTSPLVNLNLNLNLPQYDPLKYAGNSIVITQQGIKGIVIYNENNSIYHAFEISDPNHIPNDCSRMEINGIEATCPCETDDNKYLITTGQNITDPSRYPMQRYRAERVGNNVRVTN